MIMMLSIEKEERRGMKMHVEQEMTQREAINRCALGQASAMLLVMIIQNILTLLNVQFLNTLLHM